MFFPLLKCGFAISTVIWSFKREANTPLSFVTTDEESY